MPEKPTTIPSNSKPCPNPSNQDQPTPKPTDAEFCEWYLVLHLLGSERPNKPVSADEPMIIPTPRDE